ncbi:MAG: HipA domain-containing protein [Lachnospiraceae bacterium]|nr:HipA domain-containing protein [Lachnospiraceae bacterium]
MKDYSKCMSGGRYYTGAERKTSIKIKDEYYIVKFQKKSREGLRFNHISEYLGSHIFGILGLEAQETMLGRYGEESVVVIKDFLGEGELFVPFNGVGDSSIENDRELFQYTYEDIIEMLESNVKLTDLEKSIECFWDMFIVDALIANFDRHGSNWGFIKKDNKYRLAPIFDNGSCLFPQLNTDEKLEEVLASQEEIDRRMYTFPTFQIKLEGKKSSYYEVISSLRFDECNKALIRIVERMDISRIYDLMDSVDGISEIRKRFYKTILWERYNKILKCSYDALKKRG